MRRGIVVLLMVVGAAIVPAPPLRAAVPTPGGCQPNPLAKGPQTLHCSYGPLVVTPGSNMILFGPVSIESPRANGYITSFAPNMVDATTGEVPPIHVVHLHHGVWINAAYGGLTPFFATGEEKTRSIIPSGYGYRTRPTDTWVLNYMLHNLTANAYTVYITYDLTWVPLATPGMKEVVPVWLDAVGKNDPAKNIYPIYNPAQDGSAYSATFSADQDVELVGVAGHVHPGGLRDELRSVTCGNSLLFSSDAVMNQGGDTGFGSWDYRMTVAPPEWRFRMNRGDRVSVSGFYDSTHQWYEAMAIMFAWGHPLTAAEKAASPTPLCASPPTTGEVTALPDIPNPAPVFGGTGEHPLPPSTSPPAATKNVTIAAFNYYPGGGVDLPAGVHAGDTVKFTNADAAASIFHTVTSCANPCNGVYGQAYPLASWPSSTDLGDSGELGYGPPRATAATQTATWSFTVPANAPTGEVFTYFCRIHPSMRGSLEVVPN